MMLPDTDERRQILAPIHAGQEPTEEQLESAPELVGWDICHEPVPHLVGTGFGHPRLPDARPIYTSSLVYLDPQLKFARTMSRFYRLGRHRYNEKSNPEALSVLKLTGEARAILGRAFRNDSACTHRVVAPGRWTEEGMQRLWISGVPDEPTTDKGKLHWAPRRQHIVELVRRVINVRSRRWDTRRNRPFPLPKEWWRPIRNEFVFIDNEPEFASGWVDLMVATSMWLNEHYDGSWISSQLKEKFGGLRFYCGPAPSDQLSDEIIGAAEWLSECLCEDCGAPGRLRKAGGWVRTVCDHHAEEGGFE